MACPGPPTPPMDWLHTDVWTSSSSCAHPHQTAPVGFCLGTLLAVDASTRSPCWCAERLGVGAVSIPGVQSLGRPRMESGEPRSLLQHHDVATTTTTRLVLRFRGHPAHDFRRWYSFTHLSSLVPCPLLDRCRNSSLLPGATTLSGHLHLSHVLVSLKHIKNLISVCQFTSDNNCSVQFDPCSVKDVHIRHV